VREPSDGVFVDPCIGTIAKSAFGALAPLEGALQDPSRFANLLRQVLALSEVEVDFDTAALNSLLDPFDDLRDQAIDVIGRGRELIGDLDGATDPVAKTELVFALVENVKDAVGIAKGIGSAVSAADLSALPAPLDSAVTWDTDIARKLPESLLMRTLRQKLPQPYQVLHFLGVIDGQRFDVEALRLQSLFTDPVPALKARFGWGEPELSERLTGLLLDRLLRVFSANLSMNAQFRPVSEEFQDLFDGQDVYQVELPIASGFLAGGAGYARLGLVVVPVPETPDGQIDGVLVSPLMEGSAGGTFPLDEVGTWSLTFDSELDSAGDFYLRIRPSGLLTSAERPELEAGATLTFTAPDDWVLIGTPDGSKVDIRGAELSTTFKVEGGEPDLIVTPRTTSTQGAGLQIVIDPGDANGFIGDLLGSVRLEAGLDVDAIWSAENGFSFNGKASELSHQVPLALRIGPVLLDSLTIGAGQVATSREGGEVVQTTMFDAAGLPWEMRRGDGTLARRTTCDARGLPLAMENGTGQGVSLQYDTSLQLDTLTLPDFGGTPDVVDVSVDARGQLLSVTRNYPGGPGTTSMTYDANGEQTSITDPMSLTMAFTYCELERRTSYTDKLGRTVTWTYDASGREQTKTNCRRDVLGAPARAALGAAPERLGSTRLWIRPWCRRSVMPGSASSSAETTPLCSTRRAQGATPLRSIR